MITLVTYYGVGTQVVLSKFGQPNRTVNPWDIMKRALEHTDEKFVFVLGPAQMPAFTADLKKYGLEKYLIVDHRSSPDGKIVRGSTNRNYPDPRRLKTFIFQGAKNAKDSTRV